MPGILSLLLVSLSVGLSNLAGAIGIGLSGIDGRTRLRVGVAFGLFEAAMPLLGLILGHEVAGFFGHYAKYAAGVILMLTGVYTLWQGQRAETAQTPAAAPQGLRTRHLIITALALSIDNLAVGFALAIFQIQIVLAAITMGAVSVAMSLAGLELGSRLGARVGAWSDELSGGVLILAGIAIGAGILG